MVGRRLEVLWLDELTAAHLEALLDAEMERLKVQLHEHRDNAHRIAWARVKLRMRGLHGIWGQISSQRRQLGVPPADVMKELRSNVERIAWEMPRSKANTEALRAERAARQAKRAAALEAPKAAKARLRCL